MPSIRGTRTEQNLLIAFAGESQARNRYGFFAAKAKREGYVRIAHVFEETAEQERAHASRFYKFLDGGELSVEATFEAGGNGTTEQNLRAAADGEQHEYEDLYPEFARIAREEGFAPIADVFEAVCIAERHHGARFRALADEIADGTVFSRESESRWRCLNCGYLHEGLEAPDSCPACAHPQGYFEPLETLA